MELSTKGRYAVMAMADLASRQPGSAGMQTDRARSPAISLSEIADRQGLSMAYLEQIFLKLRRHGLVDSERGRSGGYRMALPAERITIGAIMAAVEEPFDMTRCGAGEPGCVAGERCLTHDLWDALGTHIQVFLDRTTLADVLTGRLGLLAAPVVVAADPLAALLRGDGS
jgi:Rrf2 family transcriptional regulator, iron-sulfur cluster assembly transcription factor